MASLGPCRCATRQIYWQCRGVGHGGTADDGHVPLHLAPMVRAGTTPLRLLSLRRGASLVWSEELIALKLQNCVRRPNFPLPGFTSFLDPVNNNSSVLCVADEEKRALIVQIGAGEPESAAKAAALVSGDCAGIDLNCGCPKPFSVANGGGMGSRLLVDPDRLISILKAIKAAVKDKGIPVSAKIRVLDTWAATESLLVRLVQEARVDCLTIHCRHVGDTPLDVGHWDVFKRVVETVNKAAAEAGVCPVPVIGNGDVFTPQDAAFVVNSSTLTEAETADSAHPSREGCRPPFKGLAGLMLARGAMLNPRIFSCLCRPAAPSSSDEAPAGASAASADESAIAAVDLIRSNVFDYIDCCEECSPHLPSFSLAPPLSSSSSTATADNKPHGILYGATKYTIMQMLKENGITHFPMAVQQARSCADMRAALRLMFEEAVAAGGAWGQAGVGGKPPKPQPAQQQQQQPKAAADKAEGAASHSWRGKTHKAPVVTGPLTAPVCRCASALFKATTAPAVPEGSTDIVDGTAGAPVPIPLPTAQRVLEVSPFDCCAKVKTTGTATASTAGATTEAQAGSQVAEEADGGASSGAGAIDIAGRKRRLGDDGGEDGQENAAAKRAKTEGENENEALALTASTHS